MIWSSFLIDSLLGPDGLLSRLSETPGAGCVVLAASEPARDRLPVGVAPSREPVGRPRPWTPDVGEVTLAGGRDC